MAVNGLERFLNHHCYRCFRAYMKNIQTHDLKCYTVTARLSEFLFRTNIRLDPPPTR